MRYVLLGVFIALLSCAVVAQERNNGVFFVEAGDNDALIDAINQLNANSDDGGVIFISEGPNGQRGYEFVRPLPGSDSALPTIMTNISLAPLDPSVVITFERGSSAGTNFRLAEVGDGGRLSIGRFNIESFNVDGSGGGVLITGDGKLSLAGTRFRNNFASADGGAVAVMGTGSIFSSGSEFFENRAGSLGGGVSITGEGTGNIGFTSFTDNTAGIFGCDLNLSSRSNGDFGNTLTLLHNTFNADCDNVLIENPLGRIVTRGNTFAGRGDAIDSTDAVALFGNLFNIQPTTNKSGSEVGAKAVCNDFGTNAFESLGFNISPEDSCALNQPTDLPNTDPMVEEPDADGVVRPLPNSPLIDGGPADLVDLGESSLVLPCGYKDVLGRGRPQDADGNGVFECDLGTFEVVGGADIGGTHSAAYFDTSRSGEGVFLEVLPDGQTFGAKFSYLPDGSGPAWFVGLGNVVDNSLVYDDMLQPLGGVFGAGFNADNITRPKVGSLAVNFPDCLATGQPGKLAFEALDGGDLEDILVDATRLTEIVPCAGAAPATAGRSGSFFDPARNGEGIFVQWLSNGSVLVIWYTFDPEGNQMWIISSDVTITGNTVVANMLYPTGFATFGQNFDTNDVSLSPWGTVTLEYIPGCNTINFSYDSSVAGYGSGGYTYSRLTSLADTSCDL